MMLKVFIFYTAHTDATINSVEVSYLMLGCQLSTDENTQVSIFVCFCE